MKISYTYIIYGLFLALLSGCELIHDDPAELGFREDGEAYAYVSLTIHTAPTAPGTRANPTGGEAGDGYEDGQTYEKAVNNLTLFFYSNDGGVNGTSVPLISHYINANQTLTDGKQPIDETFKLGPVRVSGLRTNQQYHLLVVANAGDISDDYATLAPEAARMIGDRAIFVVAGAPACKPELEAQGIRNFISVRSNVLETLQYYLKELGI